LPVIVVGKLLCVGKGAVIDEYVLHAKMDQRVYCGTRHTAGSDDESSRRGAHRIGRRKTPANTVADSDPIGVIAVDPLDGTSPTLLDVDGGFVREMRVRVIIVADWDESIDGSNCPGMWGHGVEERDDFSFIRQTDT
jgi:hypothetical protein